MTHLLRKDLVFVLLYIVTFTFIKLYITKTCKLFFDSFVTEGIA